jgi:hypothetical protein
VDSKNIKGLMENNYFIEEKGSTKMTDDDKLEKH